MIEIHIATIHHNNLSMLQSRSKFASSTRVRLLGRVDADIARQQAIKVQSYVALCGGFAAAVRSPVHAVGNQFDDGGVDQMNAAVELLYPPLEAPGTKAMVHGTEMLKSGPEEVSTDGGRPVLVRMGEGVASWGGGAADGTEGSRVNTELIAEVIETEAMNELGEQEGNNMTPVREPPGVLFRTMSFYNLGQKMGRN